MTDEASGKTVTVSAASGAKVVGQVLVLTDGQSAMGLDLLALATKG